MQEKGLKPTAFSKGQKKPDASHPVKRMRRLRRTKGMRDLLQEHHITKQDLVYPIFVEEHIQDRQAINSLPGIFRETEESLSAAVKDAAEAGIQSIILFGVSHNKDDEGTDSLNHNGLLARMIRTAREAAPEMVIIADACFCEYTDHGHCGPISDKGDVDNDRTIDNLRHQAVIAAQAGADIIAPSGMMDGMVANIRDALDSAGFEDIAILSYAAKFASHFYGPFRDAAGCALGSHDHAPKTREGYQMNPANAEEAMREVAIDLKEGADMIMVKPGIAYLDIIQRIKSTHNVPLFAYHVSGEYAMLHAAAEKGWLDYENTLMEQMIAFKRAGCNAILTYGALDIAKILDKA